MNDGWLHEGEATAIPIAGGYSVTLCHLSGTPDCRGIGSLGHPGPDRAYSVAL